MTSKAVVIVAMVSTATALSGAVGPLSIRKKHKTTPADMIARKTKSLILNTITLLVYLHI
jgi:hypothetical protein